jgi:hypothetical protein
VEKYNFIKENKNKRKLNEDDEEDKINWLDIWKINPSYKDIKLDSALSKVISSVIISIFFMLSTYLFSKNLFSSIGIGILTQILFIGVFNDQFFIFKYFFSFHSRKLSQFNPFDNLIFWQLKEKENIIFITNKEDITNIALQIFKIEVIAENVKPTLNQFIKSLSKLKVPYSYQVIHTPLLTKSDNMDEVEDRRERLNSAESFKISIYFSTYYYESGKLNNNQLASLLLEINNNANTLYSNFKSNFHHFKIKKLSGIELVNALRSSFLKIDESEILKVEEKRDLTEFIRNNLLKGLFLFFVIGYTSILLVNYRVQVFFILILDLLILVGLLLIWWRNAIYCMNGRGVDNLENITLINPFKHISFFYTKIYPDSLYLYVNENTLIGVKILNLKHASLKQRIYPGKFFRSIISQGIPFSYTTILAPTNFRVFENEGFSFLIEDEKEKLLQNYNTDLERENWLIWRSGVWRTILNTSVFSYNPIEKFEITCIEEMEEDLSEKLMKLKNSFEMNLPNYYLIPLTKRRLVSGLTALMLKNKFFRINGTHLNYLLFQGKTIHKITEIVNELKKGIETKIATEFNSPLQLVNSIIIGHTINTEFLDKEIPVGLTIKQLKNLLIVNGTKESQSNLLLKIVIELVKTNIPSIVFDYSGKWSRIIQSFNETMYKDQILHFKLGTAFNLQLLNSGLPHDKNNSDYLNYIFDTYAMTFKKDDRTMELLKNSILKDPEMDLSTLTLGFQNQNDWNKSAIGESIIALFNDLSQQAISFFSTPENFENKITVSDFVKNNKTIIIDLSILKDERLQVFATFIIISKILHFVNNSEYFFRKIIVAPNVDIVFDKIYLDRNINYWRIDKFLNPLRQAGFGLIFCANEIRYLHSNLFNYFKNLISFRTTDNRNIAITKNELKLDEFHGIGYYSSKRNSTYQIDYLMSMKENEFIMKRSDINQPFPGVLDLKDIEELTPLTHEEILNFMDDQGYDLKFTEQKILENSEATLFKKDFGNYIIFLDDIIKFLDGIKTVDKIGNIYKTKIKEELKKLIYPKASKITNNKKQLLNMRDELFSMLIKQGYLAENHPKKASGGESIRTSYSVGPKYQKALEDYFKVKESQISNAPIRLNDEDLSNTKETTFELQETHENKIVDEIKLWIKKRISEG